MAQVDFFAFLKLDGIKGEGTGGEITLESFSWGVSNTTSIGSATGGAGAGKAVFQEFSFTSPASSEAPDLFLACANGMHIKSGELDIRHKDSSPLLTISFTDVVISTYKLDENSGQRPNGPMQKVSLNFANFSFQSSGGVASGPTNPS